MLDTSSNTFGATSPSELHLTPQDAAQMNAREEERDGFRRERSEPSDIHRDWSENIGSGASVGLNNFPAKFSFDTTTANCDDAAQPDFVAYNTSLPGAAPAEASGTGTFTGDPTNGQTLKITNGANVVTLTASITVTATASVTINSRARRGQYRHRRRHHLHFRNQRLLLLLCQQLRR